MSPRRPRSIPFYGDRVEKQQLAVNRNIPEATRSIEVFLEASEEILQSLLLSRLNIADNLRRDIEMLINELAEKTAEAKLAEMLIAQRKRQKREAVSESKQDSL